MPVTGNAIESVDAALKGRFLEAAGRALLALADLNFVKAAGKAVLTSFGKAVAKETAKAMAKRAAVGGTVLGTIDASTQLANIYEGKSQNFDWTRLGWSTLLGAGLGAGLGTSVARDRLRLELTKWFFVPAIGGSAALAGDEFRRHNDASGVVRLAQAVLFGIGRRYNSKVENAAETRARVTENVETSRAARTPESKAKFDEFEQKVASSNAAAEGGAAPTGVRGSVEAIEVPAAQKLRPANPVNGEMKLYHGGTQDNVNNIRTNGIKPVGLDDGIFNATTDPAVAVRYANHPEWGNVPRAVAVIRIPEEIFQDLFRRGLIVQHEFLGPGNFKIKPEGQAVINQLLGH